MPVNMVHPMILRNQQNTQLSYELPHRVHAAKIYPIKSPNGSTIIIYGHENGVRILWRGGRAFKTSQTDTAAPKKTNGTDKAVISLDSDDEDSAARPFEDKAEFEDDDDDLDPSSPFPVILQSLDLNFGTDALRLALLPASTLKADGASWRALDPLKQKIVFTAACADNSIRLVTLPLTPPSPASKSRPEFRSGFTAANAGNGKWGETVVLLSGHQKPADGVTITADFGANSKDLVKPDARPSASNEPHLVVASHSREITGRVLLFRIPVQSPPTNIEPFQTIYLASPAKSISFNPSLSPQRASHLLVAEVTGVCRIYDHKALIKGPEDPSENPAAEKGTWLLSLYAGFQAPKSESQLPHAGAHAGYGRKSLVDAQWVSGGRAIVILLIDGEWAVWDIEGVGPAASQGLLGRQGIKGGSLSEYSLTGYIESATKTRSSGPPQIAASKFTPMTPGTRKSADPFSGRSSNTHSRGQISIVEVPSSSPTNPSEESIVFWLGDTHTTIPSLQKYWAANVNKTGGSGNLFKGTAGGRMLKLEGINLHGERCSGISQFAKAQSSTGLPSDILILGEHRFTILIAGKQGRDAQLQTQVPGRLALMDKSSNGAELDVLGIDQALDKMENGLASKRKLFQ